MTRKPTPTLNSDDRFTGRLGQRPVSRAGLRAAKLVCRKHRKTLEWYSEGRDHLEHISERLPGRARTKHMSNPGDLGNIIDSTWTFGGERWDVGLESAEKLLGIVDEFGAAAAEDLAALGGRA